ncbi:hypothetical protein FJ417_21805 [Mesorhizobium sp. B3-1-7]|nr:hypothetical protein FJ417_21805 [Mesorhizobium sp. B3-1-7]TPJ37122.1 hypothetical protein FJ418_02415 [Mesorhizobium sp. B2-8-3]
MRRADMHRIGIASDPRLGRASADGGAITAFRRLITFRFAVLLHKHGVIDVGTKGFLVRIEIGAVAVCRKLDAVRNTFFNVVHEGQRIFANRNRRPAKK